MVILNITINSLDTMKNEIKTSYIINLILSKKVIAVYIGIRGNIMFFKHPMPEGNHKNKLYKFFKRNHNG